MIPGLIKRILYTTTLVAAMVTLCIWPRDLGAAVTFVCAVAFAMVNLVVWTIGLRVLMFDKSPLKNVRVFGLVTIKVLLFTAGFLILRAIVPMSDNQSYALIAGLTLILGIATLKALGALMTGRDLITGKRLDEKVQGEVVSAGGEA